jgi:hypothetical protein
MVRIHTAFVVGVTLLAGAPTSPAQEPTVPPAAGAATKNWLVPPGKDPFGNISFGTLATRPKMASPQERDTRGRPSARPRVVCGMTVVPVTPDADPRMVVSPKPDSKVEYKIRTVSPRVCGE